MEAGVGALHITLIEFRKFVFIAPIVKVLNQGTNQCQSEEQNDSDFHYSPKMKPVMLSAAAPPPQLPAAPPRAAPAIPQAKIPVPNVEAPKTILQAVIANIAPPSPPPKSPPQYLPQNDCTLHRDLGALLFAAEVSSENTMMDSLMIAT